MRLDNLDITWGKGIFARTKRISFELSNICNYDHLHPRCPISQQKQRKILPEQTVYQTLEVCRTYEFEGVIAFHLYNEPGIDPRLMLFIDKVKQVLPQARIFLLTNGWYLNQELVDEYVRHGLSFINISIYSKAEGQRLKALHFDIPVQFIESGFDDRLTWYEKVNPETLHIPCYYPLYELCITCDSKVTLCPYDWKRTQIFGDLTQQSLEEILQNPRIQEAYDHLSTGSRVFEICRGCSRSRGEPLTG